MRLAPLGATMLSTLAFEGHDFSAAKCVDGVTSNADGWNFCMSEVNVADPWLSVELAAGSGVGSVVVWPREDCCHARLSPFEVWLSEQPGAPSGSSAAGARSSGGGARRCGESVSIGAEALSGPHVVWCGGLARGMVTGSWKPALMPN